MRDVMYSRVLLLIVEDGAGTRRRGECRHVAIHTGRIILLTSAAKRDQLLKALKEGEERLHILDSPKPSIKPHQHDLFISSCGY